MKGRELLVLLALLAVAVAQSVEKRRTSNTCKADIDCPDNAFCRQSSYCVCKEGYIFSAVNQTHKGCLKETRFGEECMHEIQCQSTLGVHAECFNETCRCKPSAHFRGGRCYESAVVGERCLVNNNCLISEGSEAFCLRGFCSCPMMFSPRDNGTRCVRDARLGEDCEDNWQCAGVGLECQGKCRCRSNWVMHKESDACIESAKSILDPCDYDVQCNALSGGPGAKSPGAALCLGGTCVCSYISHPAGDPPKCFFTRRPGQDCRVDEECVSEEDEPGYCLQGICTCKTCSPDARDFRSTAAALSFPPILPAAILCVAILKR